MENLVQVFVIFVMQEHNIIVAIIAAVIIIALIIVNTTVLIIVIIIAVIINVVQINLQHKNKARIFSCLNIGDSSNGRTADSKSVHSPLKELVRVRIPGPQPVKKEVIK